MPIRSIHPLNILPVLFILQVSCDHKTWAFLTNKCTKKNLPQRKLISNRCGWGRYIRSLADPSHSSGWGMVKVSLVGLLVFGRYGTGVYGLVCTLCSCLGAGAFDAKVALGVVFAGREAFSI